MPAFDPNLPFDAELNSCGNRGQPPLMGGADRCSSWSSSVCLDVLVLENMRCQMRAHRRLADAQHIGRFLGPEPCVNAKNTRSSPPVSL